VSFTANRVLGVGVYPSPSYVESVLLFSVLRSSHQEKKIYNCIGIETSIAKFYMPYCTDFHLYIKSGSRIFRTFSHTAYLKLLLGSRPTLHCIH
jgi:hypothetical protein